MTAGPPTAGDDDPSATGPRRGPTRPGPIGGDMAAILYGLAERARLSSLVQRHDSTRVLGLFAFVNGVISIAVLSLVALVTGAPYVFPSLGPTAFLLFYTPRQPASSPRNTLFGHGIGVAAGYLSLVVFGLTDAGPALTDGVSGSRVAAAALSLGLTSGVMVWVCAPHPPAGATTLIISLGLISEPVDLAVLMLAVLAMVVQAYVINRAAGIPYPRWRPVPIAPG